MESKVDAILKVKTTLAEAAAEALELFGEGGNPEATRVEDFVGYVNTPEGGAERYIRVRIKQAFGQALEYVDANGGSVNADLVRVEWPQFEADTIDPDTGEIIPGAQIPYDDILFDVPVYDIDGNPTGEVRQQAVGRIQ